MAWPALGALLLAWTPAPQAALTPLTDRPYWELVLRYRRGDRGTVLREIPAGGGSDEVRGLERLVRAASRCIGDCPARAELRGLPVEAAVMLHTDRALMAREQFDGALQELHFQRARRFVGVLLDLPDRRAFACRWFVGLGLWWQREGDLEQAQRVVEAGVEECKRAPELLLAAGTLEESCARIAAHSPPRINLAARQPLLREPTAQERLRRAERFYRRALEVDAGPHAPEVRLRLGWVLWRLGETEKAVVELAAAGRQSSDPQHGYLVHLFRGRVAEEAGRLDHAQADYLKAIAQLPRAPTATLALSHVLLLRGNSAESLSWLRGGLAASAREHDDPWWSYAYGHCFEAGERMEELRQDAGR